MLTILRNLIGGASAKLFAVATAIVALVVGVLKIRSDAKSEERAKAEAERLKGKLAAAEEHLEMNRAATEIERANAALSDPAAKAKGQSWVRD